jgi:hypothetical protein
MTVRRRKAEVRHVAEIGNKQEESKPHPIYSVVRDRSQDLLQVCSERRELLAHRPLLRVVGNHTAGDPPVPIPNTEVKPRWADCTARESVWESRSLPA